MVGDSSSRVVFLIPDAPGRGGGLSGEITSNKGQNRKGAENGGEMSDFSCGLSHSLCSRAVNGGEMMWSFSFLKPRGDGLTGVERAVNKGRNRKMVPRNRKNHLPDLPSLFCH